MTKEDKKILLNLARQSIERVLAKRGKALLPQEDICFIKGGAFVTLSINGNLRGCIGHFTGIGSLGRTIQAMAIEAAFADPRFVPLTKKELEFIDIEISVLSPMFRVKPEDVQPGIHGLYIRHGVHSGTLLPQVASEYGWNREDFLAHTCLKAGLPADTYLKKTTEIFAYTAEVFNEKTEREGSK